MLTLTDLTHASRGVGPISLGLDGGQVVLLCGPSGSGKTTLCGLISGDLESTAGQLERSGRIGTMAARVESQLLGSSIGQELELGRRASRTAFCPPAVHALLRRWEGREAEDPHHLSAGEQHLLLLTSLALGAFSVLIVDEGLSCLDQRSFQDVCAGLRALSEEGVLVLLVSHELRTLPWVDRCLGLRKGRLVLDKPARSVTGHDIAELRLWCGTLRLPPESAVLEPAEQAKPCSAALLLGEGPPHSRELLVHSSGLRVPPASGVMGVAGLTGSGKSRLLACMADLGSAPGWRRGTDKPGYTVMLPQAAESVLWHRTVEAELQASLAEGRRQGAEADEDVPEIPKGWKERSPRSLSQGQAKLLACLCLLLQRPDLLLLDEPFSGLDCDLRQQLERRLRAYVEAGGRLVFSTHHCDEMVLYSSHLLVLQQQGEPAYLGPPWPYFENSPEPGLGRPYAVGLRRLPDR